MGAAHYASGDVDDGGIASYRKTLDVSPNFVDAMNNLGVALDAQGKYAEAADGVRARRADSIRESRDFRASYAATLHSAGRNERCIAQYRGSGTRRIRMTRIVEPRWGRLLIRDGTARRSRNRADEKRRDRSESAGNGIYFGARVSGSGQERRKRLSCTRRASRKSRTSRTRCTTLAMRIWWRRIIKRLRNIFRRRSLRSRIFRRRCSGIGAAKFQAGDLDGAEAAFVKVLAAQPDNADAQFNLGNALFNKGQWAGRGFLPESDRAEARYGARPLQLAVWRSCTSQCNEAECGRIWNLRQRIARSIAQLPPK